MPSFGSEYFHLLSKYMRIKIDITVLFVVLYTGETLIGYYVYFKDGESCEDEKGTAYNLHVTNRKCVQNFVRIFQGKVCLKT